jgi:hypothetical protein
MNRHTKQEVLRVLGRYNADHDIGPDAPVTWREERLATAVLELESDVATLQAQVAALLDAVPSAKVKR